jgi:hypothetical protein
MRMGKFNMILNLMPGEKGRVIKFTSMKTVKLLLREILRMEKKPELSKNITRTEISKPLRVLIMVMLT